MSDHAAGFMFTSLESGDLVEGRPIEILVPGTFVAMSGRRFEFEADDFQAYVDNTQAAIDATRDSTGEPVGLAIDPSGHEEGDGAAGWIVGVLLGQKDNQPVILGEVKWTDIGVDLLDRKVRRFFSATVDTTRKVIEGGSLTNWPATRDIETGVTLLAPVELAMLEGRPGIFRLQETSDNSLDERVERVRMAWWDQSETMEGPDSWVIEVFDDAAIVQMADQYFRIGYVDGEDGIAFDDRSEWAEVRRSWIEMAKQQARRFYNQLLRGFDSMAGSTMEGVSVGDIGNSQAGLTQSATWSADGTNDQHEEDEPMPVKLAELSAEDRQSLVGDLAKSLGLTVAELAEAKNGGEPGEVLTNLVEQRANALVREQMVKSEHEREIAEFAEHVTGGEDEKPAGLPVTAERLKAFLGMLEGDVLAEAKAILGEIFDKGLTEFSANGHGKHLDGVTELEPHFAKQLKQWLADDEANTIEEFFAINQAELGKMEDYDLTKFQASDK